jgi:hypothetical protein
MIYTCWVFHIELELFTYMRVTMATLRMYCGVEAKKTTEIDCDDFEKAPHPRCEGVLSLPGVPPHPKFEQWSIET